MTSDRPAIPAAVADGMRAGLPSVAEPAIPTAVAEGMRAELPSVAERTVAEIIDEVPSYADAFTGDMGRVIVNAVELALGGFLALATASSGADASTPIRPALEGAYQLGDLEHPVAQREPRPGRGRARNGCCHV